MNIVSRRQALFAFLGLVVGTSRAASILDLKPKSSKIRWVKLHEEAIQLGDFWASHNTDPNTPERQSSGAIAGEPLYFYYNLQMQAVSPSQYGVKAKDISRGNGDYWRPVEVIHSY